MGPVTTSDEKSASAQILSMAGELCTATLMPPASGSATLQIYDSSNSTTSGKKILEELSCAAGTSSVTVVYSLGRAANAGIYCVLTGTTTYVIGYTI